jgi:NAD(P)-dependent dehydrogenase (short-subunit alcohol dehydrogenase family)
LFRPYRIQHILVSLAAYRLPANLLTNFYSPIVQLHVSKDKDGNPVPVIGPEDVARGIAFLASDESKMINGAMIPIDNAWSVI